MTARQPLAKIPINRCIALLISGLWYVTAIPSEAVHAAVFVVLRRPFDMAGALVYGHSTVQEAKDMFPANDYSTEYLGPLAFIGLTVVVLLSLWLLLRSQMRWMRSRFLLTLLRTGGLGFAIAILVTCAKLEIELGPPRVAQWFILTLFLLPLWSRRKVDDSSVPTSQMASLH